MTATNQQMTSEQLADLSTLAVQLQAKAEANDDRDTAVMAYAVQRACSELEESRREFTAANATIHNLELKITDLAVQLANAESKCRELAAENAKLADCANFYRLGFKPVKGAFGIEYRPTEQLLDDCGNTAIEAIKTPATDAFLAEVRSKAIAEYADKRGFSFQHGSIHAHFGNGDVMVGSTKFEDGTAGICFAPVREKEGGVGTEYKWTEGKNTEEVNSVFVIASSSVEGLEVIQNKLAEAIAQLRQGAEHE